MTVPSFPPGFLWGASASAFRTEGAADTRGTRRPTSAGPSFPTACARPSSSSTTASATGSRRSTSPRTAVPSTSPPRTPAASPTWEGHLRALRTAIDAGVDVRATSPGRSPTMSSGSRAPASASAWSTSTTRHCAGPPRTRTGRRRPGTATCCSTWGRSARTRRSPPSSSSARNGWRNSPPHSDQMDAFLVDAMTGPRERGCHRRVAPVGGAARG